MEEQRITKHPILNRREGKKIHFSFQGKTLDAYENEVIASALFAHGIHCFGKHAKDDSFQGIFCANGQCAQCLVLADGIPVKSCVTPVHEGMKVEFMEGHAPLPEDDTPVAAGKIEEIAVDVLVVGGGPAGLSATMEMAKYGVSILIADDKQSLGGKLSLQTHNFFGSTRECYAGTRGIDIGEHLAQSVMQYPNVTVWLESPVVGVFVDGKVGIMHKQDYCLVKPKVMLVAAGARERNLTFSGCDLPGVYGAGAFQTLVNRDLILAAKRLFIVGGGNVGLIAAYHALQAGIEVVGLVEAMKECGGYKVHLDKIKRLGVPVFTSHTILKAHGKDQLDKVTIAAVNDKFQAIPGTEKSFSVDTLLVAVGLASVNELLLKAWEYGLKAYGAGDADIVAEASAAMFSGKITARHILQDMGMTVFIPEEWKSMVETLRNRPGKLHKKASSPEQKLYPNIFCLQEIPCNPCTDVCPMNSISTEDHSLMGIPQFQDKCIGCGRCVSICPGLAITLVDKGYDPEGKTALVTLPWEIGEDILKPGETVITCKLEGEELGKGKVIAIKNSSWQDRRKFLLVEVPAEEADMVAGIRMPLLEKPPKAEQAQEPGLKDEEIIVCRCQRITKKDIVDLIKDGTRDMNSIKATLGCCMGPCGGKTCEELSMKIFREQGIEPRQIAKHVVRPFTQEVPLKAFLGKE